MCLSFDCVLWRTVPEALMARCLGGGGCWLQVLCPHSCVALISYLFSKSQSIRPRTVPVICLLLISADLMSYRGLFLKLQWLIVADGECWWQGLCSHFSTKVMRVCLFLEHLVEDCAWSPDGSLLLVVDAGGKLFIFSADTLQSIFSYVS